MRQRTPTEERALALAIEAIERQQQDHPESWLFDLNDLAWRQVSWGDRAGLDATALRLLSAIDRISDQDQKDEILDSTASVLLAGGWGERALDIIERIADGERRGTAFKHAVCAAARDGGRDLAASALARLPAPRPGVLAALAASASGDNQAALAVFQELASEETLRAALDAWKVRDVKQISAIIQPLLGLEREEAISEAAGRALDARQYDVARWLWAQSARPPSPLLDNWSADNSISYSAARGGDVAVAREALTRVINPYARASALSEIAAKQSEAGETDAALNGLQEAQELITAIENDTLREGAVCSIAKQLARAGAPAEALALVPLGAVADRGDLLLEIARQAAARADFDVANAALTAIPANEPHYAEECWGHIVVARVLAGEATISTLSQIRNSFSRSHAALEAAIVAAERDDAALAQVFLTTARTSALTLPQEERDRTMASIASVEVELRFLDRAQQTIYRISHKATRAECLAILAAALAEGDDRGAAGHVFDEALLMARATRTVAVPDVVTSSITALVVSYMIQSKFFPEATEAIASLPRDAERDDLLRRLAVAQARAGHPEQAFALVLEINNRRAQVAAYLDIADPRIFLGET